jgi:hypothetical protein
MLTSSSHMTVNLYSYLIHQSVIPILTPLGVQVGVVSSYHQKFHLLWLWIPLFLWNIGQPHFNTPGRVELEIILSHNILFHLFHQFYSIASDLLSGLSRLCAISVFYNSYSKITFLVLFYISLCMRAARDLNCNNQDQLAAAVRELLGFSHCEPLLLESSSWVWGQFRNPEERECPPLKPLPSND